MRSIKKIVSDILEEEERWAANPSDVWGLPTGYHAYDLITGGIHEAELTIWGFRTSEGKTAFLMPCVFNVANYLLEKEYETGEPQGKILIYSPEMSDKALLQRHVSLKAEVPSRLLRKGRATPEQREKWRTKALQMQVYDNVVNIEAGDTIFIDDLKNAVEEAKRKYKDEGGIALVAVDYLQLIEGNGSQRYDRVTDVSRNLKKITMRHRIPVIATAQFRRPQWGPDEEPSRPYSSDLKESGDIENSADVVGIGWRKSVKKGDSWDLGNHGHFWVEKHRNGPRGHFPLLYDAALTEYHSLDDEVYIDGET